MWRTVSRCHSCTLPFRSIAFQTSAVDTAYAAERRAGCEGGHPPGFGRRADVRPMHRIRSARPPFPVPRCEGASHLALRSAYSSHVVSLAIRSGCIVAQPILQVTRIATTSELK